MFYPLFVLSEFECAVTLLNSAPNSWETLAEAVVVHLATNDDDAWNVRSVGRLGIGAHRTFAASSYLHDLPPGTLALVFAASHDITGSYPELPVPNVWKTRVPQWRGSICLHRGAARTCYQGEVEPFRSGGTALSFHPFIQGKPFTNFFLGINLESAPGSRQGVLNISDARSLRAIDQHEVTTNSVFLLSLDKYGFSESDLPIFWSRDLSMVPSGVGWDTESGQLSWEHTHPPASMTIFGDRWGYQGIVKSEWFEALRRSDS